MLWIHFANSKDCTKAMATLLRTNLPLQGGDMWSRGLMLSEAAVETLKEAKIPFEIVTKDTFDAAKAAEQSDIQAKYAGTLGQLTMSPPPEHVERAPGDPRAEIRTRLLDGMARYMELVTNADGQGPYTQADIDECAAIIDRYLAAVSPQKKLPQKQIMAEVKRTVIELNELNMRAAQNLIETDQREGLCELILIAARAAGLESDDDITEPWRKW